jgi:hypothetical protein
MRIHMRCMQRLFGINASRTGPMYRRMIGQHSLGGLFSLFLLSFHLHSVATEAARSLIAIILTSRWV